jgi:Lrp/AsnC family leucine-responsive transcriptional regulator
MTLDNLDIKILNMLQENARVKRNVMADAIGLSLPSLSDRLKKLEENGIIEGYYTKLNRKFFKYDIMAFVSIVMESSKYYDELAENIKKTPEILECYSVLGEGSHIVKAVVKDTMALENLLSKIQSWTGVTRTVSSFVLSAIKESTKINI